MPHLTSIRPMLATSDLQRTINFYTGKLGFNLAATAGTVWCHLSRDGVDLMFNAPPAADIARDVPQKSRNYQIFYFYPDDVAALHAEFTSRGVTCTPLRVTVYGMKEFEVRDPEGYWLWFGEPTDEHPTVTEEELKGCE